MSFKAALETGGGNILCLPITSITAESLLGSEISGFKVERLLAQTHLSWVYLASKNQQGVAQKVVIKILPPFNLSKMHLVLFERERKILSTLHHPGIAMFIDAGLSEQGYSYLIMEYVEGTDLASYCRKKRLTVKERVTLILQILNILKYAHSRLVIHRDLKPSNILVTDDGFVKLLDFGIAKLLSTIDDPDSQNTMIFTPQFASPEQFQNEEVSIATDLFQLGQVSYKLLCGYPAYQVNTANIKSMYDSVIYASTLKLDSMIKRQGNEFGQKRIALERSTTPRQLLKQLDTDLSKVILHAIEPRVKNRYNSVNDFSADLSNWLERKPISLSYHFWWYRTRKFCSRHRQTVLISAISLIAVVSTTVKYLIDIKAEQLNTQYEAYKLDKVATFLTELLQQTDTTIDDPKKATVEDIVLFAANKLMHDTETTPAVQQEMVIIINGALTRLQRYKESIQLLEYYLAYWEANTTAEPDLRLSFYLAQAYYDAGEMQKAETLLNTLINNKYLASEQPATVGQIYNLAASIKRRQQQFETALALAHKAIEFYKKIPHDSVLHLKGMKQILNLLGGVSLGLQQPEEAIRYFEESLTFAEKLGQAPNSLGSLVLKGNIAILYSMTKQYDKGIPMLEQTLRELAINFPTRYISRANQLNTYAVMLSQTGNNAGAITAVNEAIALYSEHLGSDSQHLISAYENLSNFWQMESDSTQSLSACDRAKQLKLLHYPKDEPLTVQCMQNTGQKFIH